MLKNAETKYVNTSEKENKGFLTMLINKFKKDNSSANNNSTSSNGSTFDILAPLDI